MNSVIQLYGRVLSLWLRVQLGSKIVFSQRQLSDLFFVSLLCVIAGVISLMPY